MQAVAVECHSNYVSWQVKSIMQEAVELNLAG
jgi:hypothetical protein